MNSSRSNPRSRALPCAILGIAALTVTAALLVTQMALGGLVAVP